MKNSIKQWIKSAAGQVSIGLFVISLLMLIVACSSWNAPTEKIAYNTNNILFGISTNLLGIIVTVSFVQFFLDKQNDKQEEQKEIAQILRYNRLATLLIDRYLMYFFCITTPINERKAKDPLEIRDDFNFDDMCDLYEKSMYLCEGVFEPSVVLFYKSEEILREYFIDMIENIDFKYNDRLLQIIMYFVESSLESDVRGVVLSNINTTVGKESITKEIKEYIKDSSYQWVEKAEKGELNSNMMYPYVILFQLLKTEIDLLKQYKEYISNLK